MENVFILFDNGSESYSFISSQIKIPIYEVYSSKGKYDIIRWLRGVINVIRKSHKHDTIICWFDFQAVLCYWFCRCLFTRRKIVCINIMLKDKKTIKNRVVAALYRKALSSDSVSASVTSMAYGSWLNKRLKINADYALIHDVYRSSYEWHHETEETMSVFCGGRNGRDWSFMINLSKRMPHVRFNLVMPKNIYEQYKSDFGPNISAFYDVDYVKFMSLLCRSSLVCLPLDTEAPSGLIVMFQAAANFKMVIASKTVTIIEYIKENTGVCLPNNYSDWERSIDFHLSNPEARKLKASSLHDFLEKECSEKEFVKRISDLVLE